MPKFSRRGAARLASASIIALAAAGWASWAAAAPAADDAPGVAKPEVEVQEVIVTAAKGKAAEAAPVKSNLAATEPQAVITRKVIEETTARVGDYTTTAVFAPSMAAIPNPNGSGATDGGKITLRGFQDGEYNTTYDGIAWGDTNGPTHHGNSFFPNSVIGGVVIDRGPGRASDLGQANFGGSLNLFSLPVEDHPAFRQTLTGASYNTFQSVSTFASGPMADFHDANVVLNFMEYRTDGRLSNSPSDGQNQFFKGFLPLNNKWSLTALATRNTDEYNQGDASAAATVAQTEMFGKYFALSNDARLATYKGYNFTKKDTDFGYLKLDGDLGRGLTIDNTLYTYYYHNHTLSANNDGADQSLDPGFAGPGFGPNLTAANKVITFAGSNNVPNVAYPAPGSGYAKSLQVNGIPGYTKRNQYQVDGDIFKGHQDFGFGVLTFGALYEHAFTQRERFDFDLLTGLRDYREKAAALPGPSGCENLPIQPAPRVAACENPLNVNVSEFSGWDQYQLFSDFDWKPTDKLTITPGVKYINFELRVHAPEEATSGSIQPTRADQTFTKTLPFLTVNYRLRSNWSFYAQYAQGFLVPNITIFDVNTPANNSVVPQQSTNYQAGTVYSAGKLTVDADVYYIDFQHKIQTITITDPTSPIFNDSVETNSGGATYKGIELEGTYLLPYGLAAFANFTVNQAVAKDDPLNPGGNGKQIAKAPRGTAALGLRYEHHGLLGADDDLISNVDAKWIGEQFQTAASGAVGPTALIHSFNDTTWTTTYKISNYSFEFQLLDLFNNTAITSFKGKALIAGTDLPATTSAQGGAANVFTYQVGRSFQLTLKAAF